MTSKNKLETFLPGFGGFYGTHWEDLHTMSEEIYADMHAADEEAEGGADVIEIRDMLSDLSDFSKYCASLSRLFCESFGKEVSKGVGFELGLKFAKLKSPSEYNFRTDRIVATMPTRTARKLFDLSKREGHERLTEAICDWFTPYDGFAPYYSNTIDDWISKPVANWDKNELCVLLDAFTDGDIDEDIYSDIADSAACKAFEDSVDWKKFEAMLKRRRNP